MKLVSVNVSFPCEVIWMGKTVRTGIFKEPVSGRLMLRRLNLDGDRQADLSVHGGPDKAVYFYPGEHYEYWRRELPEMDLRFGMFGENFTTDGILETGVCIGDRIRVGGAEVMARQPRLPCYKLGVKFQSDDMVKRFLESGRTGFYCSVLREGEVEAGDAIEVMARDERQVPVPEITRLYIIKRYNRADLETVRRVTQVEALPESWRSYFRTRLENARLQLP